MVTKSINTETMQGAGAFNSPLAKFTSASRLYMSHNQKGQGLDMMKPDLPRILNGFESQERDYCIQVKAPCDLTVVQVLNKYLITPKQRAEGLVAPKVIIYQSDDDGTYGYLETNQYAKYAEYFGMKYDVKPFVDRLQENSRLAKGTVLAECHSIIDGMYAATCNVNVAAVSTPGTIEDGYEVSESLMARMQPRVVGSKQARWGKSSYLVKIYGNKPFPEPGDRIRKDGLLFAIRDYDPVMDSVNLLEENITKPDLINDKLVYATPDALVYDIDVLTTVHDNNRNGKKAIHTPEGLRNLALQYHGKRDTFNKRLIEAIDAIPNAAYGQKLTPDLQALVTRAIADRPGDVRFPKGHDRDQGQIIRSLNAVPLEEFNVEIHYCKEFDLGLGAKMSSLHGGKGVACRIRPDHEMPVDDFGNRADITLHGTSVVSRLIAGQLYEQYINAASRDVSKDIRVMCENGKHKEAWEYLCDYYDIVSPTDMGRQVTNVVYNTQALRNEHLDEIIEDGIRLNISLDDPDLGPNTYKGIKQFREPDRSPLTVTDYDGEKHRTTIPILIGEVAMVVLEKSATKPQAECTARLQNNGLPASATVSTRDTRLVKRVSGRVMGETELRGSSAMQNSALCAAEVMELATCPEVTHSAIETIFTAKDPMDIPYLVDRRKIPLGRSRSIGYFNHLFSCAGGKVVAQDKTRKRK